MEEFERACCIRGYHEYKEVWEAAVGEELVLFVVENISRVLFSYSSACTKNFNSENLSNYGILLDAWSLVSVFIT